MDNIENKSITEYESLVKRYIEDIEDFGVPVEKSYIFGSRIKGDYKKYSDLDVCVVSSAFGIDSTAEWVFLNKVARKVSDLIEPHSFSPKDFNNKYNLLAREIKRTGKEVRK